MTYPCRFIFVHFNAWEFVGSDILWAGIVTNLAGAIEDEFGIMTSRIFRLLNVDVIHSDASSNEAMESNGINVDEHLPTKKYCPLFGRFCKHFTKHPKTTLCLPNLCWLLLFCSAFVCLLFITIQAAKALNTDIKRVS